MTRGARPGKAGVIDAATQTFKSAKENTLAWSQQGPAGPAGPQGAKGDSAVTLFALVRADASLVNGRGVTSVEKTGTGHYQAFFDRDISQCSRQVSVEGFNGTAFGIAEMEHISATGMFVGTLGTNATFADRGFDLSVIC